MLNILRQIEEAGCSKLNVVVHVGAGACPEIDGYLRMSASKVVLAEANADLVVRLEARCRSLSQVSVVPCAVSTCNGEATLHIVNNRRDSSLLAPEAVLQAYPNLRVIVQRPVKAITLEGLNSGLELSRNDANLLVLEVQGAEQEVINSASKNHIQGFQWIAVRASNCVMFAGGATVEELKATMSGLGFSPIDSEPAEHHTPFVELLFKRNDSLIELLELRHQLNDKVLQVSDFERQLEVESVKRADLISELNRQTQLGDTQAAAVEAQRLELDRLDKERTTLATQVSDLISEKAAVVALTIELESQLNQITQSQQEHASLAEEWRLEIDRQATARESLVARVSQLESENSTVVQHANALASQVNHLTSCHQVDVESLAVLKLEISRHVEERDSLTSRLFSLDTEKIELGKRVAELDGRVGLLTIAHQEQYGLAQVRQGISQSLRIERDGLVDKLSELECELAHLSELKGLVPLREENLQRIAALERQTNEQASRIEASDLEQNRLIALNSELAKLAESRQSEVNECLTKVSEVKAQLSQTIQTENLISKLLQLRENDLADLRTRYKEAQLVQQKQHHVMLQLEEKLRIAATYFNQLKNNQTSDLPAPSLPSSTKKKRTQTRSPAQKLG